MYFKFLFLDLENLIQSLKFLLLLSSKLMHPYFEFSHRFRIDVVNALLGTFLDTDEPRLSQYL